MALPDQEFVAWLNSMNLALLDPQSIYLLRQAWLAGRWSVINGQMASGNRQN